MFKAKRLAIFCLLFGALSLCSAAERGTLLELGGKDHDDIKSLDLQYVAKAEQDLAAREKEYKAIGAIAVYQQLIQKHLAGLVPSRRIKYVSRDSQGLERTYSARVFMPTYRSGDPPIVAPLVVYQHATETRRTFTPYNRGGDETMLGAIAAEACGFVVAMPDGDGMGADPSPKMHAYCHAETDAACLIDLIRAVHNEVNGQRIFDEKQYKWSGETFIVGYSEGGYISMAAVKELTTHRDEYEDIELTGAACMSGPFDFDNSIRSLLVQGAKAKYDRPYIPAYLVAAWQVLYPRDISMRDAINPKLLTGSENAETWLKGTLSGDKITTEMQTRLTGNPKTEVPAREVLNEAWVKANVDPPNSRLNKLFAANDLTGDWKPYCRVLLVHDPYDQTVPYDNSKVIHDQWLKSWKKKPDETKPIGIVDLAALGKGSGHVGGAILGIPMAFIWIRAGMPENIWKMTKKMVSDAIMSVTPDHLAANVEAANAAMGLVDENPNRALLPLSKVEVPTGAGAKPYTLSYLKYRERLPSIKKFGKVKIYTIEPKPVFTGQRPTPGTGGYTKLAEELKAFDATFKFQPGTTYYMAVYPEKFQVGMILQFAGGAANQTYTVEIEQMKNKVVGRQGITSPDFTISPNFKAWVRPTSYDRPDRPEPFISLP